MSATARLCRPLLQEPISPSKGSTSNAFSVLGGVALNPSASGAYLQLSEFSDAIPGIDPLTCEESSDGTSVIAVGTLTLALQAFEPNGESVYYKE